MNKTQQYRRQHLLKELRSKYERESAKKLILKIYTIATLFDQVFPDEENLSQLDQFPEPQRQALQNDLIQFKELVESFKSDKQREIKKFIQIESYMLQETQTILNKKKISFFRKILNKICSMSKIFLPNESQSIKLPDNQQKNIQIQSDSYVSQKPSSVSTLSPEKNSQGQKPSIQDCCSMWEKVKKFYQEHKLDQAHEEAEKFQNYLFMNNRYNKLAPKQIQLLRTINFEYKTMTEFYEYFKETGYTFDKEDNGIKLWYKIIGEKDIAIKIEGEVQISIQNFLCIASEIDLFEHYVPFTYETRELKSISRNQKIGTTKLYIPLLTDRQIYFYAACYDRLKTNGSIFFFSKTINEDQAYQQKYHFKVPKESKLVRLQYKYYILEYVPISRTRGKINMVSSIDLKMDYLPLFIINKSARMFSFDYINNFRRINKHFQGSKWEKVMQEKKQMYDYFRQKINEYLPENNNENGNNN